MKLPSPSIEFLQEAHLYVERTVELGKRLVILAEAEKGALYEPVLVHRTDIAVDLFGSGNLVKAYEDATTYKSGLDIYLMRVEPFQYEAAFSVLETMNFDLLFLDGFHFDANADLYEEILAFAKIKQDMGTLIHVITTLSRSMTFLELKTLFDSIKGLSLEAGDETEETGKYLSVVTDQMEYRNAGAVYAGLLAATNPEVSPINKSIPSVSLEVEFTKDEILELREAGIVCFKTTFKNGVTCTSSSCAVSTAGSVHKHISNFRIAQSLINQISLELQPFIGTTNLRLQTIDIEEILIAICEEAISQARIRDYDYAIAMNELMGYLDIEIEAVPIFSVHGMTARSRMRVFK